MKKEKYKFLWINKEHQNYSHSEEGARIIGTELIVQCATIIAANFYQVLSLLVCVLKLLHITSI